MLVGYVNGATTLPSWWREQVSASIVRSRSRRCLTKTLANGHTCAEWHGTNRQLGRLRPVRETGALSMYRRRLAFHVQPGRAFEFGASTICVKGAHVSTFG